MKTLFWLVTGAAVAVIVFILRYVLRKHAERERAEEARAAEFVAQMTGATRPAPAPAAAAALPTAPAAPAPASSTVETQKLLFDAARKAGDAGEPALAIQLYGRLLARFPDTAFAAQVRAAAEVQKKKLKA